MSYEIGRTDPVLLTGQTEGPRLPLLAGHSWRVTWVDWKRRRCFAESADRGGKARWISPHGFDLDERWWPTSEHHFQAQKFIGTTGSAGGSPDSERACSFTDVVGANAVGQACPMGDDGGTARA